MNKTIIFLLAFFLFSSLALADYLPNQMQYWGILTDSAGNKLSGSHIMNFSIWTDSSGGNMLWYEDSIDISANNGFYYYALGSTNPLNLSGDQPYYLERSVDGEVISPRINMTMSMWTQRAQQANNLTETNNYRVTNINAIGNISANYFIGNGSLLTDISGGGNPFDQSLNTTDNVQFNSTHIGNATQYWSTELLILPLGLGTYPLLVGYSDGYLGNIGGIKNSLIIGGVDIEPQLVFFDPVTLGSGTIKFSVPNDRFEFDKGLWVNREITSSGHSLAINDITGADADAKLKFKNEYTSEEIDIYPEWNWDTYGSNRLGILGSVHIINGGLLVDYGMDFANYLSIWDYGGGGEQHLRFETDGTHSSVTEWGNSGETIYSNMTFMGDVITLSSNSILGTTLKLSGLINTTNTAGTNQFTANTLFKRNATISDTLVLPIGAVLNVAGKTKTGVINATGTALNEFNNGNNLFKNNVTVAGTLTLGNITDGWTGNYNATKTTDGSVCIVYVSGGIVNTSTTC